MSSADSSPGENQVECFWQSISHFRRCNTKDHGHGHSHKHLKTLFHTPTEAHWLYFDHWRWGFPVPEAFCRTGSFCKQLIWDDKLCNKKAPTLHKQRLSLFANSSCHWPWRQLAIFHWISKIQNCGAMALMDKNSNRKCYWIFPITETRPDELKQVMNTERLQQEKEARWWWYHVQLPFLSITFKLTEFQYILPPFMLFTTN